jgi:hypothetical protein
MVDHLKPIIADWKQKLSNWTKRYSIWLIFVVVIGFISFKIGSCTRPQPTVQKETKIDTVFSVKEIISYVEKKEVPKQSFPANILHPIQQLPVLKEEVLVPRQTPQPSFPLNRFLVFNVHSTGDSIVIAALNPPSYKVATYSFLQPSYLPSFFISSDDRGVSFSVQSLSRIQFEGLNISGQYGWNTKRGNLYLWTGLNFFRNFSIQTYLDGRGEIGLKTNWRLR